MEFENAEIDGMSLFDILESDLKTENLIPAFGSRKKFMRARMYLSAAYNITSLEKLNENMEKNRNTSGQQDLTLFDNTFATPHDPDDPTKKYTSENMEPWQAEEFKKTRNVSGGVTLVTEMAINMFERVHPAVHLVVLVPGGACALLSENAAEHKALLKLAKEKGDMTIAYGPAKYAKLPPGMTSVEYATKLRKRAIFVSDVFGVFFFAVTAGLIGIVAHLGELGTIHEEPGGIVGIVFGGLGLFAFSLPRIVEHAALTQGKLPPLYGEGGTRNDILDGKDGEDGGDAPLTLMEGGGGGYEDDEESEFTPLTPNSRNRKNRNGF
ncbi:hypothetical protein TrLO_g7916 [Triparma laevis f. longispina]|uniref:Uncharacterized protein n=1 Tax=Triparma laevis f. longispina TaxID=1714387 RepID=A0A9W7FUN8_9STRA|nr:hypothetical protein TrLO_g7916 [Triparma laevis f. longispina]